MINAAAESPRSAAVIESERAATALLLEQAEALDDRRWGDFIKLFTPDAVYWMPADPSHMTWEGVPSIFCENVDLMTVRKQRLEHPKAWSMAAPWGTSHIVSNVRVEALHAGGERLRVRSRVLITERRRDDFRTFAGRYTHDLVRTEEGLRVALQRVDLLGPDQIFDYVLQAWL